MAVASNSQSYYACAWRVFAGSAKRLSNAKQDERRHLSVRGWAACLSYYRRPTEISLRACRRPQCPAHMLYGATQHGVIAQAYRTVASPEFRFDIVMMRAFYTQEIAGFRPLLDNLCT